MGWEDAHLHQFVIQGERYGSRDRDALEPMQTKDEREYTLGKVAANAGRRFLYHYDFGDNWQHVLTVEKTFRRRRAACTQFAWPEPLLVRRKT